MKKNTLLWKIEGEQLTAPSYLFGSMHVQDQRAFQGLEYIQECIDQCDAFAAEYNLNEQNPIAFQQASQLPAGESLQALLNPRIYKKLAKIFERETGQDLEDFDQLKPAMIVNILTAAQFSEDHQEALDQMLFQYAENNGKEMMGLETFERQMEIMEEMSLTEQLRSLKSLATNFKSFRKSLKKTAALYVEGDIQKILKKVKESSGQMRKVLLFDRNFIMADRILEIIQQKSLFTVVGAGHLGGGKGLIHLLKSQNLKVQPIIYK